jgi:hypothetical protein
VFDGVDQIGVEHDPRSNSFLEPTSTKQKVLDNDSLFLTEIEQVILTERFKYEPCSRL